MTTSEFLRREQELKVRRPRRTKRDYKQDLLNQMRMVGLPAPETEQYFHPKRRWKFDFRIGLVAIEFEGGMFEKDGVAQTGHGSLTGLLRDQEKYNEAQLLGYIVIRVNAKTVGNGQALQWIERAVKRERESR
ncbi:MAG: hypothetical protein ABIP75_03185 [Pyrinomonadaceae bacterium]